MICFLDVALATLQIRDTSTGWLIWHLCKKAKIYVIMNCRLVSLMSLVLSSSIRKILLSTILEYCTNNTAAGTSMPVVCVDKTYVICIIRSSNNRQAFLFHSKVEMHCHLIQKQTYIDFTHSMDTLDWVAEGNLIDYLKGLALTKSIV